MPIRVVIEKLRGFVADHRAQIVSIDGNKVQMAIDDRSVATRRRSDRPLAFSVDLQFDEEMFQQPRAYGAAETRTISRTRIRVAVSPRKRRDRRRADAADRATEVLLSFRSYLMASEDLSTSPKGVLRRAQSILVPWLSKR